MNGHRREKNMATPMDLTRKGEIDKQRNGWRDWKNELGERLQRAERSSCRYRYTEQAQLLKIDIGRAAAVRAYIIIIISHSMSSDYVGLHTHGQSCLNEVRRINLVLVYCACACVCVTADDLIDDL